MNNLLLGGPASTAVAAIWACSLFATSASSEMVPLGVGAHSGHVGPGPLLVEQHGNNKAHLGIEPQDACVVFTTETDRSGAAAHLQLSNAGTDLRTPARFQMSMDLEFAQPAEIYREAIELAPLEQTGVLRIGADILGVSTLATVRLLDLASGTEQTYQIQLGEETLELHLDPGTYRLLLEGTLDPEASTGSRSRVQTVPTPASLSLLGALLACVRRRRR